MRDERGHARFPRREIERIAEEELGRVVRGAPAKVAGKAFKWFAQGKTWQEVVILLTEGGEPQPVEVVRKLHAEFLDEGHRDASSTVGRRGKRSAGEPSIVDEQDAFDEDAAPPPLDADAWRREQEKQARRAQEELEREQRAWEDEMRRHAEERAQRYPAFYKTRALPASAPDEPAPISERLMTLLQLVAARNASGQ